MTGLGTVLDVVSIAVGTAAGVVLGDRVSKKLRELVLGAIGLFIIILGVQQATQALTGGFAKEIGDLASLIVLGSLVVGGMVGGFVDIEWQLKRLGVFFERRFSSAGEGTFLTGFLAATLLFCIGPMAVLGAFEDGLTGNFQILAVKSLMDGFAALALASGLGWGVGFSLLPMGAYQGGLTILAKLVGSGIDPVVVSCMSAIGGVLVLGVGVRMLELKEIPVANLLPAIVVGPSVTAVILLAQG
ncbi:DUF554 domain-containing protein [Actinomadura terrae]|uniref:DUF554 domain-containing protein n=1 Tax=Actinomadura terrae TaxID=604353 RepID=UPI001FA7AF12|nr:DUF554 domain-containing protein [Actinomadura terrae]